MKKVFVFALIFCTALLYAEDDTSSEFSFTEEPMEEEEAPEEKIGEEQE